MQHRVPRRQCHFSGEFIAIIGDVTSSRARSLTFYNDEERRADMIQRKNSTPPGKKNQ